MGGGIYTKAADVGADLVGKVEAGIPEDDPRNPATIADNVGDNVGDVAGMGADLYESYAGSILATAALGASAFMMTTPAMQLKAVLAPMLIAAAGVVLSIIGIFMVRTKEGAGMKQLLGALGRGVNTSAFLIAVATFVILYFLKIDNWIGISFSVIVGLFAGIIIGQSTEYYTSQSYKYQKWLQFANRSGCGDYFRLGPGYDFNCCSRGNHLFCGVLAYLSAISLIWPIFSQLKFGFGSMNRYYCRWHAFNLRYYVGYGRL